MTATSKTYKTRDSAVTVLRKAGIDKIDYITYLDIDKAAGTVTLHYENDVLVVKTKVEGIPAGGETLDEEAFAEETTDVSEILAAAKARNEANAERLANPFSGLGKREDKPAKTLTKEEKAANRKAAKEAKDAIAKAAKPAKKPAKVKAVVEKKAGNKNGISAYIRGLIEEGKTNAEILEMAEKDGHDLTGKKRYFPAWYRFDMKRKAAALAAK